MLRLSQIVLCRSAYLTGDTKHGHPLHGPSNTSPWVLLCGLSKQSEMLLKAPFLHGLRLMQWYHVQQSEEQSTSADVAKLTPSCDTSLCTSLATVHWWWCPPPAQLPGHARGSPHLLNELFLMQQVDLCHIVLFLQSEGKVRNAPDGELLFQGENNVLGREGTQMVKQHLDTVAEHC